VGLLAELDGATDAAFGGADDEGDFSEAFGVECFPGGCCYGELLFACAVGGFAVGAHGY